MLGFDPDRNEVALKERTGIVLQRTGLEPYLTVAETIDMFRGYYPRPLPLDEVLEVVGLKDQSSQRVRRLSGGQQRRLDVAVGLAGDPELLFLDEPTTGFDPTARRGAWAMIRNLRERGKTILLTTHYLDEAQELADRVAIMMAGKVVAEDTPDQLISADSHTSIRFRIPEQPLLPSQFESQKAENGLVEIRTTNLTYDLHALTSWAIAEGIDLTDLTVSRLSLEDVFLRLTGEVAGESENIS